MSQDRRQRDVKFHSIDLYGKLDDHTIPEVIEYLEGLQNTIPEGYDHCLCFGDQDLDLRTWRYETDVEREARILREQEENRHQDLMAIWHDSYKNNVVV
jgi:hypothetical protein